MTEFDLALEFLQSYAGTLAAADPARGGDLPDGGREYRGFCGDLGVDPTPVRGELVRDLAGVINECVLRGEHEPDEEVGGPGRRLISATSLADGLERHGWRPAFLTKRVRD